VAGENIVLGFSLLQDGNDVLARACDRHLPVYSGLGEAPACHRYGDIRGTSRLASHDSRWLLCPYWQGGWSSSLRSIWQLCSSWQGRVCNMRLGRRGQWLVLDWNRVWSETFLWDMGSNREQELTAMDRYHGVILRMNLRFL